MMKFVIVGEKMNAGGYEKMSALFLNAQEKVQTTGNRKKDNIIKARKALKVLEKCLLIRSMLSPILLWIDHE